MTSISFKLLLLFAITFQICYSEASLSIVLEYAKKFRSLQSDINTDVKTNDGRLAQLSNYINSLVDEGEKSVVQQISTLKGTVSQIEADAQRAGRNIRLCLRSTNRGIESLEGILESCRQSRNLQTVEENVAKVSTLRTKVESGRRRCILRYALSNARLRACFDKEISEANNVLAESGKAIREGAHTAAEASNKCTSRNLARLPTLLTGLERNLRRCALLSRHN